MGDFGTFGGMQVSVSPHLTKWQPRFPDKKFTKRRRRRVVGKYGSWGRHVPSACRFGNRIIVHPEIYREMQRQYRQDSGGHRP